MAGNLIIPRVEVYWGSTNLTSYNGNGNYPKGDPLVYKVECTLPQQSDNPSGSMMWVPTAEAYKIYEKLLNENANDQIVTTFGYAGKKKVSFVWMWGGNGYTYGNTMALRVFLLSELSGLINANIRSVANNEDKSMTMLSAIQTTEKLFAVKDLKLIRYTSTAQKDLQDNKIQNQYGRDQTFVASVNNIVKENGNYVFSTNIVSEAAVSSQNTAITGRTETASKLVIFTPFQYEEGKVRVLDGQSRGYNEFPDPAIRYGYLLGPSLINTHERSYQWAPPQQEQMPTPAKTSTPKKSRKRDGKAKETPVQKQQERASGRGAVSGPALAATNPGISVALDKVGPEKKILQQQEAAAKLSFSTFLVPALVGIKPYDIVYIPALDAKGPEDIEDWIVNTVDYNQTDGGVEISVTASRSYGYGGSLMNVQSGVDFLEKAQTLTTLEKWEEYAWTISTQPGPGVEGPVSSSTGLPAGFSPNGDGVVSVVSGGVVVGSAITYVDGNYDFRPTSRGIPLQKSDTSFIDPLTNRRLENENFLAYNRSKNTLVYYANSGKTSGYAEPVRELPASPAVTAAVAKNNPVRFSAPSGGPVSGQILPGAR